MAEKLGNAFNGKAIRLEESMPGEGLPGEGIEDIYPIEPVATLGDRRFVSRIVRVRDFPQLGAILSRIEVSDMMTLSVAELVAKYRDAVCDAVEFITDTPREYLDEMPGLFFLRLATFVLETQRPFFVAGINLIAGALEIVAAVRGAGSMPSTSLSDMDTPNRGTTHTHDSVPPFAPLTDGSTLND